ncbi:hypothetical protein [Marilutibacter chinensis]|uniref:Uncharacterized protein n=1 Tax=Marilutibacter chinensis TaxID=2912247 RepID=A0ABS9HZB3_9GAMM|nr:hypothetical protein [Lysobacter chinensis]MCF7223417.1 hypothetical protein [Lysobacter chinensis]
MAALAISLLSGWISYRAHRHSVRVGEEESRLAFSREKSEFLVRIDKARATFDRLGDRLEGLLNAMDRASDKSRASLTDEAEQLKSDLKYLEGCKRQAWSLWDETYEMNQSGLAHHKPRFLKLIEDDEQFASDAQLRCDRTEEAMAKAATKIVMFTL